MYYFQKYILVILIAGSALAINPAISTDVFEFPKLLVLLLSVGLFSVANIADIFIFADKKSIIIPKEFWFLIILLFAEIVAFIFSTDRLSSFLGNGQRQQGLLTDIHYLLLTVNSFYFFTRYPHKKTKNILNWLVAVLVIACLIALSPYAFPNTWPIMIFSPEFFSDRAYGSMGNPNYLASFLISALPFLIMKYGKFKHYLYFPAIALSIATLFLTGSRSAWLAIIISFLVLGIINIIKNKSYKVFFVTLTIIAVILGASMLKNSLSTSMPSINRLSMDTEKSTSIKTRLILWDAGLSMAPKRLLTGFGQDNIKGNIEEYLPEYLKSNDVFFVDSTHSEFIDILVTRGIVAFLCYILFFTVLFFKKIKRYLNNKEEVSSVFIALLALMIFHGLNFSTITGNTLLFIFTGIILAECVPMRKNRLK